MTVPRRAALLAAAGSLAGSLAGCGFRPLYGPLAHGGTVRPELAAIFVAVMGERQGQLLRQALEARLGGAGSGVGKQYELTGGLVINSEGLGIQQDSSTTRQRITGTANWSLYRLDTAHTLLASGSTRVLDGININNQQYFAVDLETSAATRRIADTAANQITLEIASFFRAQADKRADKPA